MKIPVLLDFDALVKSPNILFWPQHIVARSVYQSICCGKKLIFRLFTKLSSLGLSFPVVLTGLPDLRSSHPGNKLPGYFRISLTGQNDASTNSQIRTP